MPAGNPNLIKGGVGLNQTGRNRYTAKKEKAKELALLPPVVSSNSAEVLVTATNKIIDVYNKLSNSIKDEDIVKMDIKDKINAIQKLSFLHQATKQSKTTRGNMNFIKINTSTASVEKLENAILEMDNDNEEQ